jgi:glycolate oxidase
MEVVLPTGDIVKTKPLFRNAMGYDITTLITGSEGTLGVITEVTFRLIPQPDVIEFSFYLFDSLENGFNAAEELKQNMNIEYFDLVELSLLKYSNTKADFLKKYMKSKLMENYIHSKYVESSLFGMVLEKVMENTPVTKQLTNHLHATMKMEGCLSVVSLGFEGKKDIVKVKSALANSIMKKYGGFNFQDQTYYEKRFGGTLEHISEMLIHVSESSLDRKMTSTLDLSVPQSKIIELSQIIHNLMKKYKNIQLIAIDIYSHLTTVGVDILVDLDKPKEYRKFMDELKSNVIELNGSLSFAHGVGIRFAEDMSIVFDKQYLDAMKKIKKSLDPNNILNPGKLGGFDGIN